MRYFSGKGVFGWVLLFLLAAPGAFAADQPELSAGDTSWILISTALVMLMTPGLAFFYGGMVRRKNVLGTMMHSIIAVALISLQWILWGYTLAFGPDAGGLGIIGGLQYLGLHGILASDASPYAKTIPHYVFIMYQCMFAIITPALISGAMAERINFKAYVLFILLWATFVYDPLAHWFWGDGGWLQKIGWLGGAKALDFAGGAVVHISSGMAALVFALMLGRRKGYPEEQIMPHNLPFTILGAGLLWFGWFGFNAGSAVAANTQAASALLATNTAGASAALTWMFLDWITFKKPTALGTVSGAIAGLATVTPAAGFVTPAAALLIGVAAGALCRYAVQWRSRRSIDDSLDVFGVHGIGGLTGVLLTGVFASPLIAGTTVSGLVYGNWRQFVAQAFAAIVAALYSMGVSFVLVKILDVTIGLRVTEGAESEGLDRSQHGEAGYPEL